MTQAKVKPLSHREGSKAEQAHKFVRAQIDKKAERKAIIAGLLKQYKLKPTTANHWYGLFKKHPVAAA